MKREFKELGERLIAASWDEGNFSARGIMDDLFPAIYTASKRMSARAISRWLKAESIMVSDVTIAKALRTPEKYAGPFAAEMETAARTLEDAFGCDTAALLSDEELFWFITTKTPEFSASNGEEAEEALDRIEQARSAIGSEWYSTSPEYRALCMQFITTGEEEAEGDE